MSIATIAPTTSSITPTTTTTNDERKKNTKNRAAKRDTATKKNRHEKTIIDRFGKLNLQELKRQRRTIIADLFNHVTSKHDVSTLKPYTEDHNDVTTKRCQRVIDLFNEQLGRPKEFVDSITHGKIDIVKILNALNERIATIARSGVQTAQSKPYTLVTRQLLNHAFTAIKTNVSTKNKKLARYNNDVKGKVEMIRDNVQMYAIGAEDSTIVDFDLFEGIDIELG